MFPSQNNINQDLVRDSRMKNFLNTNQYLKDNQVEIKGKPQKQGTRSALGLGESEKARLQPKPTKLEEVKSIKLDNIDIKDYTPMKALVRPTKQPNLDASKMQKIKPKKSMLKS